MDRTLNMESVEGEIALIIEYVPGESEAITVLQGAMRLIESLDGLDHCLLSSINTSLEPVSILNDVQHSSLKILLARALKRIPDDLVSNLDWKKWVGGLLVKGKYKLLEHIDSDAPAMMVPDVPQPANREQIRIDAVKLLRIKQLLLKEAVRKQIKVVPVTYIVDGEKETKLVIVLQ